MTTAAIILTLVLGIPLLILAAKSPERQNLPSDWVWVRRQATSIARWRASQNAKDRKVWFEWVDPLAAPVARPGPVSHLRRVLSKVAV